MWGAGNDVYWRVTEWGVGNDVNWSVRESGELEMAQKLLCHLKIETDRVENAVVVESDVARVAEDGWRVVDYCCSKVKKERGVGARKATHA